MIRPAFFNGLNNNTFALPWFDLSNPSNPQSFATRAGFDKIPHPMGDHYAENNPPTAFSSGHIDLPFASDNSFMEQCMLRMAAHWNPPSLVVFENERANAIDGPIIEIPDGPFKVLEEQINYLMGEFSDLDLELDIEVTTKIASKVPSISFAGRMRQIIPVKIPVMYITINDIQLGEIRLNSWVQVSDIPCFVFEDFNGSQTSFAALDNQPSPDLDQAVVNALFKETFASYVAETDEDCDYLIHYFYLQHLWGEAMPLLYNGYQATIEYGLAFSDIVIYDGKPCDKNKVLIITVPYDCLTLEFITYRPATRKKPAQLKSVVIKEAEQDEEGTKLTTLNNPGLQYEIAQILTQRNHPAPIFMAPVPTNIVSMPRLKSI